MLRCMRLWVCRIKSQFFVRVGVWGTEVDVIKSLLR